MPHDLVGHRSTPYDADVRKRRVAFDRRRAAQAAAYHGLEEERGDVLRAQAQDRGIKFVGHAVAIGLRALAGLTAAVLVTGRDMRHRHQQARGAPA
jgi:hypothetical protein